MKKTNAKSNVVKLPTACAKGYDKRMLKDEVKTQIRKEKNAFKKGKFSAFLRAANKTAKRPGSAAGKRFADMVKYLTKNRSVTPEMLLKNTTYTNADLKHDMAKGFISFGDAVVAA